MASASAVHEKNAGVSVSRRSGFFARFLEPKAPSVAIEVRAASLGALKVTRQGSQVHLVAAGVAALEPGVLKISMSEANILDRAAFGRALGRLLERIGGAGDGRIGLVLPDLVARVALLPAAELADAKPAELPELVRFRLKKAVPFNIRDARVRWSFVGEGDASVLATAALDSVVRQYEEAAESAGLAPGRVELSSLALLDSLDPSFVRGDCLFVNADDGYVSLVLARDGQPLLVRTLADVRLDAEGELARELASTAIYHRERLGGANIRQLFVRLPESTSTAALGDLGSLTPVLLDPWPFGERGMPTDPIAGATALLLSRAS